MITTTLNRIRAHSPCDDGWKKLLNGLGKTQGDDEPLPYATILELNGLYDALWCCRAEPQEGKVWRLFTVWCGRQVQHVMRDARSIAALDVAERYAHGNATDQELAAARVAAWNAVKNAVGDVAKAAAWVTDRDAAKAVVEVAAWADVRADARDAQSAKFKEMVS